MLVMENPYYNNLNEEIKENLRKKIEFNSKKRGIVDFPSQDLLDEYNVLIERDNILYITMDILRHIVVLTKDNKLYVDNILYSKGVLNIIEFNKTNLIFVYENNVVEFYSNGNNIIEEKIKYNKVLYGYNFLATLKDNYLDLYYLVTESTDCTLIEEETFRLSFLNVDDIKIELNEEDISYIEIDSNNGFIKFFLIGMCKLS